MGNSFIRSDGVKIYLIPESYCKWCSKPIRKEYSICANCKIKHPLIEIRAVGIYPLHRPQDKQNQLGKEIWQLKDGDPSMADKLGECMVHVINNHYQYLKDVDIIVPVPAGGLEREYNQAALLAKYVSENISIPCKDVLYKKEEYPPQHNITSLREKEKAIRSKIGCSEEITGKKVLLIDDVYVTGNTKNECVRALKDCGAGEILGLVIGRADDQSNRRFVESSGGNYEQ